MKAADGVHDTVFDFASLILHVKSNDIARIVEVVRKIEPEVEIVPKSEKTVPHDHDDASGEIKLKKELSILIVATALFILQLFF